MSFSLIPSLFSWYSSLPMHLLVTSIFGMKKKAFVVLFENFSLLYSTLLVIKSVLSSEILRFLVETMLHVKFGEVRKGLLRECFIRSFI